VDGAIADQSLDGPSFSKPCSPMTPGLPDASFQD
jgi:hypothetical protein